MALMQKTKPVTVTPQTEPARDVVERIVLDEVSFDAFSADMMSPSPPNAKLRALFLHKKQ